MTQQEYAKVWQVAHIQGLELLQATFTTHSFPKHFHASYGIGLSDQSHFTRCFKRVVGVTPGTYRHSSFIQDKSLDLLQK